MPEQSPRPGDDLVGALVADEVVHDVAPDAPTVFGAAVEAGPEIDLEARRKKGLGVATWLAIIFLVLVVGAAILAPVLPIPDPIKDASTSQIRKGPSGAHPFGSDVNGRDVLSRVIWGARNSMLIGVLSISGGFIVGGIFGVLSGYFKGWVGGLLGSLTDILLAFPQLILALSLVTFLGHTVSNVTLALAIVSTPVLARIARASTLSWSEREFVTAARAQGARHGRVMIREIVPNVLPAMFSIALLGIAVVVVAEAGLAIIGAGVKPDVVTWGNIIVGGQGELRESPHIVLAPSIMIFLTVLSLNYLGDVVRARFDVREAAI